MKEIYLTQGKVTLVDDSDYDELMLHSWYYWIGDNNYGYAATTSRLLNKRLVILMHQMIIGSVDNGYEIDHKDRDGLNNQRSNLRVLTYAQNQQNAAKRKNCTSKYKGICFDKQTNKWKARIQVNGISIDLGYYHNEISAAEMYDLAAKLYFGEFAGLNFPHQE